VEWRQVDEFVQALNNPRVEPHRLTEPFTAMDYPMANRIRRREPGDRGFDFLLRYFPSISL
jgi:hypothetical protein